MTIDYFLPCFKLLPIIDCDNSYNVSYIENKKVRPIKVRVTESNIEIKASLFEVPIENNNDFSLAIEKELQNQEQIERRKVKQQEELNNLYEADLKEFIEYKTENFIVHIKTL